MLVIHSTQLKNVLDQLVKNQELSDIHFAFLWNVEHLVITVTNIQNSFRSAEHIMPLLDKQILNPELLNLDSLDRTISDVMKSFSNHEFIVDINRCNIPHIVKL